jgi:hypothetical protein
MTTFKDLLKENINDYKKIMNKYFDEDIRIDYFNIQYILSGTKLIAHRHNEKMYHEELTIYKYRSYYILFSYHLETYGNEEEVICIREQFGDHWEMFKECIEVYHESKFNYEEFLDKETNLLFLIDFFKNYFEDENEGFKMFNIYTNKKYQKKK